jgi:ABC-type branched-subunit amino acid transport system ATPase component
MKMKINPLMVATALVFATPAAADDIHETVATNLAHAIPNLPGYVPEQRSIVPGLSVLENLRLRLVASSSRED